VIYYTFKSKLNQLNRKAVKMAIVSEEIVDETCEEVNQFTPDQIKEKLVEFGEIQPDLFAFMWEFTQELEPDSQELGIYLFFSIYRMFQKSVKENIEKIPGDKIIKTLEENENFIAKLEGTNEKFFESIVNVIISKQPNIIRYLVENLFDADFNDDYSIISEDDKGYLFLLLKTVIDLLNMETENAKIE